MESRQYDQSDTKQGTDASSQDVNSNSQGISTHGTSDTFISSINQEIAKGFRFVPFIGSGISKASGIMLGNEFTQYLSHVMCRTISPLSPYPVRWKKSEKKNREEFNVLREGWPEWPDKQLLQRTRLWTRKYFVQVAKEIIASDKRVQSERSTKNISSVELLKIVHKINEAALESLKLYPTDFTVLRTVIFIPDLLDYKDLVKRGSEDDYENIWKPIKKVQDSIIKKVSALDAEDELYNIYKELLWRFNHSQQDKDETTNLTKNKLLWMVGVKAMFDWRAMLNFLSQLQFTDNHIQILPEGNQSIIDGFVNHVVGGKKPNLSHYLLAQLKRPLRFRLFLTTNFDTLMDQALNKYQLPYSVLAIGNRSELPSSELVNSENVLLKLHGGKINTRADFSLDKDPDERDIRNFKQYLSVNTSSDNNPKVGVMAHLLVLGFSGADERIMKFFAETLRTNSGKDEQSKFKIFWICHNQQEIKELKKRFLKHKSIALENVNILVAPRADLFLYELYQKLTFSLPPAGFSYELVQDVPPNYNVEQENRSGKQPASSKQSNNRNEKAPEKLDEWQKEYVNKIVQQVTNKPSQGSLISVETPSRVGLPIREVFLTLSKMHLTAIWLELEDFVSPQFLAAKLLKTLAVKNGNNQKEHIFLDVENDKLFEKDFDRFLQTVIKVINIEPSQFVLFMYGRNGPGGCSAWQNNYWTANNLGNFEGLLNALLKVGFKIVYMPYTLERFNKDANKSKQIRELSREINKHLKDRKAEDFDSPIYQNLSDAFQQNRESGDYLHCKVTHSINPQTFDEINKANIHISNDVDSTYKSQYKEIIEYATDFIFDRSGTGKIPESEQLIRLQFVYALTLFRQSRHPSALYTEGVFRCPHKFNIKEIDNDAERAETVEEWLKCIKKNKGVLFRKSGGYLWFYRDIRMGLRTLLESLPPITFSINNREGKVEHTQTVWLIQMRARMHYWIGEWYARGFASIGHSTPAVESLYHRIECIKYIKFVKPRSLSLLDEEDKIKILNYRFHLLHSALMEIIKTLRVAKEQLAFWMHGNYGTELFKDQMFFVALGINTNKTKNEDDGFADLSSQNALDWFETVTDFRVETAGEAFSYAMELKKVRQPNDKDTNNTDIQPGMRKWLESIYRDESIHELLRCLQYELEQVRLLQHHSTGDRDYRVSDEIHYKEAFSRGRIKRAKFSSSNDIHVSKTAFVYFIDKFQQYCNELATFLWQGSRASDPNNHYQNVELKSPFLNSERDLVKEALNNYLTSPPSNKDNNEKRKNEEDDDFILRSISEFIELIVLKPNAKSSFVSDDNAISENGKNTKLHEQVAKIKQDWISLCTTSYYHTLSMARAINGLIYLHLQHAKTNTRVIQLKELRVGKKNRPLISKDGAKNGRAYVKQLWVRVSVLSWLGLDLLQNLHPDFMTRERSLKFNFLVFYGLSLAHLGRYYESHRRFNEATAYVNSGETNDYSSNTGVLRLRRAEAHLVICENIINKKEYIETCELEGKSPDFERFPKWIRDMSPEKKDIEDIKTSLNRLFVIKLDDAQIALESAEACLSEVNRKSLWWGNVHFIQLKLIRLAQLCQNYDPIVFRQNKNKVEWVKTIFDKGWLLCAKDGFRRLRLLDEFIRTIKAIVGCLPDSKSIETPSPKEYKPEAYEIIHEKCVKEKGLMIDAFKNYKLGETYFKERTLKEFVKILVPNKERQFEELNKEHKFDVNGSSYADGDYSPTKEYTFEIMHCLAEAVERTSGK